GLPGKLFRLFSPSTNEYLKTIARWILGKDALRTTRYLLKGQKKSIRDVISSCACILPNSPGEDTRLRKQYGQSTKTYIVPNGINARVFRHDANAKKNPRLVVCAARIEGLKNQLNLIHALNDSEFTLVIAGAAAPNQTKYLQECRRKAAANILFTGRLSENDVAGLLKTAKVHALPSWFETCGLSTLEAAAMGCNVVITDKGYTRDYFGDHAFYCNPADPESILSAVRSAAASESSVRLQQEIATRFTWEKAAEKTLQAYQSIMAIH
ncbi:MAG TPA: glycosyltransferase family 4 protein, partial [Chitinophagaceae bacterium]